MAIKLDGKMLSAKILEQLNERSKKFGKFTGRAPRLYMIMVGANPASRIYVRRKEKACEKAGVEVHTFTYDEDTDTEFLLKVIAALNRSEDVDGIMVQMPLPPHIDSRRVTEAISPEKDVDGLTSINQGRIITGEKGFVPCTAKGVIRLLKHYGIPLVGRSCAIFGRSLLVGKPLAALLTNENCTVTLCHSKTDELTCYNLMVDSDIIVCAVGIPRYLTVENTGLGQVLVDVGINRLEDGTVVGDIPPDCYDDAYAYTPVPGGVGPMTVAMLVENTIEAAEGRYYV